MNQEAILKLLCKILSVLLLLFSAFYKFEPSFTFCGALAGRTASTSHLFWAELKYYYMLFIPESHVLIAILI